MVCRTRRKIDAGVWASGAPGPQSATAGCGGVGLSCQAPHQGVHHDVARLGRSQLSTLLSVVPAPCRVVQGVHVGLAQREGPVRDARRQRGRRAGHELGRQAVAVVAAERWVVRQQVGRLGAALSISGKAWLRAEPHHLCTPAWGTLAKASAFASHVRLAGRLLVLCSLRAAVRGGLSSSVRHDSDLAAHSPCKSAGACTDAHLHCRTQGAAAHRIRLIEQAPHALPLLPELLGLLRRASQELSPVSFESQARRECGRGRAHRLDALFPLFPPGRLLCLRIYADS